MVERSFIGKYSSISKECRQCKGKCLVLDNSVATQKRAKALFGVIPNQCVNGGGNITRCPAALGLL